MKIYDVSKAGFLQYFAKKEYVQPKKHPLLELFFYRYFVSKQKKALLYKNSASAFILKCYF